MDDDEYIRARQSSKPFEIVEPTVNSASHEIEDSKDFHWRYLGYIDNLNPIPPLRRLMERLFPPRNTPIL